jgi:hypothetical protein
MFLSTIQLMRLSLTTIKHLMQKNTAELTERWKSRLNCRHFPLTERLRVQENKNKGLEGQSEKIH